MKPTETLSLPPLLLRAHTVPGSFDPKTLEFSVTFASERRALKIDKWGELFEEELSLDPSAIRLDRLNAGGPVLNAHGQGRNNGGTVPLEDQIGRVIQATATGGPPVARLRMADVPSTAEIRSKLDQDIIRGVSVGYRVLKYRDITTAEDTNRVLLAVDWEPFEITLVPIPEDFTVGLRSANSDICNPCLLEGPDTMKKTPAEIAAAKAAVKEERTRSLEIRSLSTAAGERVSLEQTEQWIEAGTPVLEVRSFIDALPKGAAAAKPAAAAPATTQPAAIDEVGVERIRSLEIARLGRVHELESTFVEDHLQRGTALDSFRSLAMNEIATREESGQPPTRSQSTGSITVGEEEGTKRLRAMQNALDHRAGVSSKGDDGVWKLDALSAEGRNFRSLSLIEYGKECLSIRGMNIDTRDKDELARRSILHTAGDFPGLLANTANKALRKAYDGTPRTWLELARMGEARDFKAMSRIQLGDAPALSKVGDSGEVEHGSMGEATESYAVETYAKTVGLSRKAMINDDLGGFTRIARAFGRSSADKESEIVWGLITANAIMGDGNAIFSGAHSNTGTGAISVAAIAAGQAAMRLQKGVQNERGEAQFINATPSFLVVPAILESVADQFITSIVAQAAGDVNPFAGNLRKIVDPRLDASSTDEWYLATNPDQVDVIEFAYLDGVQGPQLFQEEGFSVEGMKFKARLDFGALVLDHRGLYRSSGV